MTAVIAAAGRGTRAYPHTRLIPKAMLDVYGRPVLEYTLAILRDQMKIRDVVIVVGEHGAAIRERFGDGSADGVSIRYVQNDRVKLGLGYSVLLAREHVEGSHFVLMLSDELYWNSNHSELLASMRQDSAATVTVRANSTQSEIRKNFSVEIDGEFVRALVEKPEASLNGLLGCGTYVFGREIFEVLDRRLAQGGAAIGDLTAAIRELISQGKCVRHFELRADYININYQEDIHRARAVVRRSRLPQARVSLVMPCESELTIIKDILRRAHGQERIAETILVARRHDPAIQQLAQQYGSRLIVRPELSRKAYGAVFRAGIEAATSDIIALTMDDESFELGDLEKLIAYMCDADLVLGTRTTSQLVQQGSNLTLVARVANWLLAKMIELLWLKHGVRLTDAGCTFRAFWRDVWTQMESDVKSEGPVFAPEMIVEALRRRMWVLEIPINYCRWTQTRIRVEHRNAGVFFKMAAMILTKRLKG